MLRRRFEGTTLTFMASYRKEIMIDFLQLLQKKYGGVEEYLRKYIELADDDISTIRRNILVPKPNL